MAPRSFVYSFLSFALLIVVNVSSWAQESKDLFEEKYIKSQEILFDDPEKAVELGAEAYQIAEKAGDMWAMAIANMGLGYISYELGQYKVAFTNYNTALRTLKKADTTDYYHQTLVLNEMALIQSDFNNHDQAIEYYEKALVSAKAFVRKFPELAQQDEYFRWLIDIPYYMAIEYQEKGAHQTAGKILVDLWERSENKNDIVAYAQVLNELGAIKLNNAEYGSAQEYFGLIISSNEIDDYYKAMAYHNLATAYLNQGEFERAESYFMIGLDMTRTLEDPESLFISYQDIGELEFRRGDLNKAIEYWETALNSFDDIETDPELYSIYNWLQRAYMDIDIEKAKEYNLKYTQLNDFYVKNQTVQRELEAQNRQELNTWIDEQRQQRVDAEQRQRFIQQFWPVFLGVGLVFIFSLIIGVRYLRTVRANKALAKKQMGFTAIHTRDEAA